MKRLASLALITLSLFGPSDQASATMPVLAPSPNPATVDGCQKWASEQGEDAVEMWGIHEDSRSYPSLAVRRLTSHCLGEKTPEIVGFGSSAGFDDAYCGRHPDQKICSDRKTDESSRSPATIAETDKLSSIFIGGDQPKIAFFGEGCDADNRHECIVAEASCSGPGAFDINVFGYDRQALAALLLEGEGKATITTGIATRELHLWKMDYSEMNDAYDLLLAPLAADDIWRDIAGSQDVVISLGSEPIGLPKTIDNRDHWNRLVKACTGG